MKKLLKSIVILSLIFLSSCSTQEETEVTNKTEFETYNKAQSETCPDEEDPGNPNHPPEPDPHWANKSITLKLHRDLRDNFLLNNNRYKKYVDYYYSFSKEVSFFDFTWETKVKIWDSKDDLNNTIFNLLNPEYNGVIINENFKNHILSITNDLKKLTKNKYMFDEFEDDLNSAVNKTKQELLQ